MLARFDSMETMDRVVQGSERLSSLLTEDDLVFFIYQLENAKASHSVEEGINI